MELEFRMIVILALCVLCTSASVHANGFAIFDQGARAAGMANAFVARASDPSAVWYNPAGLTKLKGFQIYIGGHLINTGGRQYYSIYRDRTLAADPFSNILPNFYVSYQLTDNIGLGLSINSPFNYEITWPQTSEVEHLVYILKNLEIRSLAVSPAAAVRLGRNFSLGVGMSFYSYRFNGQYHYPYDTDVLVALLTNGEVMDTPDTLFDLRNFKARGISFFVGMQWEIISGLSFGATYRRGRPLTFDSGTVNAWEPEIPNAYAGAKLAELFPDSPEQSAVVSFSMVDQLSAGIAWQAFNFMQSNGVTSEERIPCDYLFPVCNYEVDSDYYYLNDNWILGMFELPLDQRVKIIKYATQNFGPVAGGFVVYEDWGNYQSGVYLHDNQSPYAGHHSIAIVGWVDDVSIPNGGYWIVKNDFGEYWGENGYFRIGYGECEIDMAIMFAQWDPDTPYPVFSTKVGIRYYYAGETTRLDISARVPEGNTPFYQAVGLPQGARYDQTTGLFTWTPTQSQMGAHEIEFIASYDIFLTAQTGIIIIVPRR